MEINGKLGNLTPAVPKTPEPMAAKFGEGDDVGDTYSCAKFHYERIRGFCFPPRLAPTLAGAYSN